MANLLLQNLRTSFGDQQFAACDFRPDNTLVLISHFANSLRILLVRTAYVVLLSIPGVSIVTAAEFAGEMGPIVNYANDQAITGRAGIYPSRYQSDKVNRSDGPLVRRANRKAARRDHDDRG